MTGSYFKNMSTVGIVSKGTMPGELCFYKNRGLYLTGKRLPFAKYPEPFWCQENVEEMAMYSGCKLTFYLFCVLVIEMV
jgi:hypothetical protein